jgi:hypothetical protein
MPAGNTYEAIATNTLGSNTASVTFSSIPGTYTDLVLIINGTQSSSGYPWFQLNGDTASNYSDTQLYATTSVASSRDTNQTLGYSGAFTTSQSTMIFHFMNYSNTTTYKTVLTRDQQGIDGVWAGCTLWRSTAAINSIYLHGDGARTFQTGTTFSLYGIKAA